MLNAVVTLREGNKKQITLVKQVKLLFTAAQIIRKRNITALEAAALVAHDGRMLIWASVKMQRD